MRLCLLMCGIVAAICAPLGAAELKMPVWKVGQSWMVACPGMAETSRFSFMCGAAKSVKITVEKDQVIDKERCRLLKIVPEGLQQTDIARATVRAWYRAKDLALVRVKILVGYKEGGYNDMVSYSMNGRPIWDLDETQTYIPLQMPRFPIKSGAEATCFTQKATPAVLKKHPKAGIVRTRTVRASASGDNAEITISFHRNDQFLGQRRDEPILEQVWSPGEPWWTSAKRLSPSTGKPLFEYDLGTGGKSFVPTKAPEDASPVPYLFANENGVGYAGFRDEDGVDQSATRLLVDNVDYIKWAENHGDYLSLQPMDDITPDFDAPHDIDFELRDMKGNSQLVGLHKHVFGRNDPTRPSTITGTYTLYRDGPVLFRIRGQYDGIVYRRVASFQKRGQHSFTWDGNDDFGSPCGDDVTVFEIGYTDSSEWIAVLD